jgi:uncharacterized membrane protein YqjE
MAATIPRQAEPAGLRESLRAMGGTLGEALRVRGALFALELRQEVARRQRMLLLSALGIALLNSSLLVLALLVAAAFWDTWRLTAISFVLLAYGTGAAIAWSRARAETRVEGAFEATLAELQADLGTIGSAR